MRKAHALPLGLALVLGCSSTPEVQDTTTGAAESSQASTPQVVAMEAAAPVEPAQQDSQAGGSGTLKEARQEYTLAEQKRRFLVDQHVANARTAIEELRLDDAETELAAALELEPDGLEAKQLLSEVRALQGEPVGEFETLPKELDQRWKLREEQLRSEARESFRKGQVLLARGDYDGAIAELTLCLNHIRWAPYSIDWAGMDTDASDLLERAKAERTQAMQTQARAQQQEAYEKLRQQQEAEKGREQTVIDTLLARAIEAFDQARYDDAQELARKVLKRDPRNEKAQEIDDTAFRAGREKVREDYLQEKKERFKQWEEYLHETTIPWTDTITLPDEDYWKNITELRKGRSSVAIGEAEPPEDTRLRAELSSTRIPGLVIEDEESIDAVIDIIRTYTDLPLVVDPAADEAAIDEGVLFTYDLQNPLTVEQALNIITADAGPEVTWTVRHEAVLVTTREKARGALTIVNHDVQDLVFGLTDFLGPRIDRLRLLDDLEDEDGGGPFGGIGERTSLNEMEDLLTLIQENVAVGSWEDEGVAIDGNEGFVLVVHTPEVQAQVRQFLDDLRRFTSSLVTIDSKFLAIEDNWIQEIGVDWRGLDNPGVPFTDLDDVTNGLEDMASSGLDNLGTGSDGAGASGAPSAGFFFDDGRQQYKGRSENFFGDALGNALSVVGGATLQYTFLDDVNLSAILTMVEKSQKVNLVNDQILSVQNSQRAYVSVINQRAYIQDFDVEVAQFQSIADPQVNVLTEGVVLDVRPTIHEDRQYLTLEIQPTVANVVNLRPFSTTLGGGTQPVEFQLPELEVQSVFTTAVIPDGGSILLGGLSNIRNIERRAEVPWIAKVPIVGFFFKQEGYNDEKKSLMILIRARITDVTDELAKLDHN